MKQPAAKTTGNRDLLTRVVCVGLALVTLGLYWPVKGFEFCNFDDPQYLAGNPNVQNGFTLAAIKWAFTTGYASNWHPLTWLSYMLDIQMFGLNAGGHHMVNVVFHAGNTLLLFLLLRRLTGAIWRPAFVAGLFAWHPMHVESVAWVAERKDVLSGLFWMLTLLAYTRYVKASPSSHPSPPVGEKVSEGRMRGFFYALALFFFALGLMAKPMLVSLPLVLLLLDYWPLGRICDLGFAIDGAKGVEPNSNQTTWTKLVAEKIPFFVLSAISCVVTFIVQQKGEAVRSLAKLPLPDRLANAVTAYVRYIGKLVWPRDLAVIYPLSLSEHHPWVVAGAAMLLIAICVVVAVLANSHRALLTGWLWFLITLVPVIGLVQVGGQAMADRYSYLPSIGLFIMLAWEIPRLLQVRCENAVTSRWRFALALTAVAILCAFAATAAHQLRFWRNSITLFTRALAVTKGNYAAEENLGLALAARGKTDEGILHERAALAMFPGEARGENALGTLLLSEHKDDEAIEHFRAAVKTQPHYDQPYYNLGVIYLGQNRFADAAAQFQTAIGINPQYEKAIANLGMAFARQGRLDDAIEQYRRALAISAGDAYTHNALGVALEARNQTEEAVAQYLAAVACQPNFVDPRDNLGLALLGLRRYPQAEEQFAAAAKLQPDSAAIQGHLGDARRFQGNYQGAAAAYAEAKRRRPDDVEVNLNFGRTLVELGRSKEAIDCYRTALRGKPNLAPALQKLAWLLATDADDSLRDGKAAVTLATQATQQAPADAAAWDALGAAQAEAGQFPQAVIAAGKALNLANDNKNLAREIQSRLELYQAGKAYHQR